MSVVQFPRAAQRSIIPGERAARDVAADFERLVRAGAAGVTVAKPGSVRETLVRIAARALLQVDEFDRTTRS